MKYKISISISEETVQLMKTKADHDLFRNKSHFIEYAIRKLIKEM